MGVLDGDLERCRQLLAEYLSRNGLKQTRQREAILHTFLLLDDHVTSEDLHERVRTEHPEIGAATVYRTLKIFCEAGIANPIHFREGVTLYEKQHTHHDHLICLGCGEIIEFHSEMIEREQVEIAEEHGYSLVRHRHHLFGFCGACQREAR